MPKTEEENFQDWVKILKYVYENVKDDRELQLCLEEIFNYHPQIDEDEENNDD